MLTRLTESRSCSRGPEILPEIRSDMGEPTGKSCALALWPFECMTASTNQQVTCASICVARQARVHSGTYGVTATKKHGPWYYGGVVSEPVSPPFRGVCAVVCSIYVQSMRVALGSNLRDRRPACFVSSEWLRSANISEALDSERLMLVCPNLPRSGPMVVSYSASHDKRTYGLRLLRMVRPI